MNLHQSKYYLLTILLFIGCQSSNDKENKIVEETQNTTINESVVKEEVTTYNWNSGNFEDAKSLAGTKLILLDFYTET